MPGQLPAGWVTTTLGEITVPSRHRVTPIQAHEIRYIGLEHIEPGTMTAVGHGAVQDVRSSSFSFSQGDLLYGRLRPYLNKVWVAEFDGLCSGEFLVFPTRAGLNNHFLAARLSAKDFVAFASERASGERPRVSFESLSHFPLALPPSAEQDRIVLKLSAALSRTRAGEVAAKRARLRVERYRSTVVQAAVTGELSQSWREGRGAAHGDTGASLLQDLVASRRARWEAYEEHRFHTTGRQPKTDKWKDRYKTPVPAARDSRLRCPPSWAFASIDELSWISGYGTSVKCSYDFIGTPVLRIPNIRHRELDLTDLKFSRDAANTVDGDAVAPGDMLVIRTNGSKDLIGRAAVVTKPLDGQYGFASYLVRFRLLGDEPLWSWVSLAWDSQVLRSVIESKARTTAGQYNVSLSRLSDIAIPLPPLSEQREIIRRVTRRMAAADRLTARVTRQLSLSQSTRERLLNSAFRGRLVPQDRRDAPASGLLARLRADVPPRRRRRTPKAAKVSAMKEHALAPEDLKTAWTSIGKHPNARHLFDAAQLQPEQVFRFYEVLRQLPGVMSAFSRVSDVHASERRATRRTGEEERAPGGRFRMEELWLENFKNLKDYTARFNANQSLDVMLGWNGAGKSNLFEALVILFRDLHAWSVDNRWPATPMSAFRVRYEVDEHIVEVSWSPNEMKRPTIKQGARKEGGGEDIALEPVARKDLRLPRFIFGYYSGPTNRLAGHFLPMKQGHYERLRKAKSDDAATLAALLDQRRFFCAETHHAKYVLLAFSYREDPAISKFLRSRLRIEGFESALFVIRKPRWAKADSRADDFWGATGIMRRVLERLRKYAVAPMVLKQRVNYGYRSTTEEHYYFFLPDLSSLHDFASDYGDARTFFLALESTDFSELIHDVKIQMRIRAQANEQVPITFNELSEGEQQLLMVLGLMRFTQSHQSLVLLDEPDTHLNPRWSTSYLKDLARVMATGGASESSEQRSSQIIVATHDPLVIASLFKEQVHLLVRNWKTGRCEWLPASVDPRGLGFTGILTSEMFGFRSDLDEDTVADLDRRVRLVAKEDSLTEAEQTELEAIDKRLEGAGFSTAFSDPYYAAFVRAWGRKYSELMVGQRFLNAVEREEVDRIAQRALSEARAKIGNTAET